MRASNVEHAKKIAAEMSSAVAELMRLARSASGEIPDSVLVESLAPALVPVLDGMEAEINRCFDEAFEMAARLVEGFPSLSGEQAAQIIRELKGSVNA